MPPWTPIDEINFRNALEKIACEAMPKKKLFTMISKMMNGKFSPEAISHKFRNNLKPAGAKPVKSEPGETPQKAPPSAAKPRARRRNKNKTEDSEATLTPSPTPPRTNKRKQASRTPESSLSPDLNEAQTETVVRRFPMRKCPRKSYKIQSDDESSAHDSGVDEGVMALKIKTEDDECGVESPKGLGFEEEEMEL